MHDWMEGGGLRGNEREMGSKICFVHCYCITVSVLVGSHVLESYVQYLYVL